MALRDAARQGVVGPVDLRDVDKVYNPFDVAGATKATPGVDWATWLETMGIAHDQLIVGQPSYFKELGKASTTCRSPPGRTT